MNTQIKSDQLIKIKNKNHTHIQSKKIGQTHNHKISNIPYENELFLLIRKIPWKFNGNSIQIEKNISIELRKKAHQKMRWQINRENQKKKY